LLSVSDIAYLSHIGGILHPTVNSRVIESSIYNSRVIESKFCTVIDLTDDLITKEYVTEVSTVIEIFD
jgi:hypothetical protein